MNETKTLEQLEKDFEFTLSKLSHEIRNPVTLINSFLQLLEAQCPAVTETDCWGDILDNMDYLKTLLDELSSYNNAKRLHLARIYPDLLLEKVFASVRPTLEYLNIVPELQIRHPLPAVSADEQKLRQALLNLLRNAQEALPEGGSIRLFAEADDTFCRISVSDTGAGIRPEDLPMLFDPFVTHKAGGSGLGLAVTKSIVDAHHGTIAVDSLPGSTTFTISLPLAESASL